MERDRKTTVKVGRRRLIRGRGGYLKRYVESDEYQPGGFFFGSDRPFDYWGLVERAKNAWKAAGLEAIGLHECRHTFRSWARCGSGDLRGQSRPLLRAQRQDDADALHAHARRAARPGRRR